jgi:hypothetical protein
MSNLIPTGFIVVTAACAALFSVNCGCYGETLMTTSNILEHAAACAHLLISARDIGQGQKRTSDVTVVLTGCEFLTSS